MGIPAIIMEMLAYSRPGVLEVLPALSRSLPKGSIEGMLTRTFARVDKLGWDLNARTVDLKITSLKNQDITLIVRHGIESISASAGALSVKPQRGQANCDLHLAQGTPVEIRLTLGRREPLDWTARVAV
jgi:hypothetical protein